MNLNNEICASENDRHRQKECHERWLDFQIESYNSFSHFAIAKSNRTRQSNNLRHKLCRKIQQILRRGLVFIQIIDIFSFCRVIRVSCVNNFANTTEYWTLLIILNWFKHTVTEQMIQLMIRSLIDTASQSMTTKLAKMVKMKERRNAKLKWWQCHYY